MRCAQPATRPDLPRHFIAHRRLPLPDWLVRSQADSGPRGRDEIFGRTGEMELVRSGLDDTMRGAYQAIRAVWHGRSDVQDLRVAAYIVSIGRIATTYQSKGL